MTNDETPIESPGAMLADSDVRRNPEIAIDAANGGMFVPLDLSGWKRGNGRREI